MSRLLPQNLYLRQVTGTSQSHVRPQNLILSEQPTGPLILQSISISPSPGVLYVSSPASLQMSPTVAVVYLV